jgi:hypothetical protein
MRSLFLSVDDHMFDRLVNFLKLFPASKLKVEEVICSQELRKEIKSRKEEVKKGEAISHDEFWSRAGL